MTRDRLTWRGRCTVLLVPVLATGVLSIASGTAHAEPAVPETLTGELLTANTLEATVGTGLPYLNPDVPNAFPYFEIGGSTGSLTFTAECDEDGGTISFTSTGAAAGPYPGTYSESGTITLGAPGSSESAPYLREIVALTAQFAIDSPLGNVVGTKSLGAAAPTGYRSGVCSELIDFGGGPTQMNPRFIISDARYEATIDTSAGAFNDRGITGLRSDDMTIRDVVPGTTTTAERGIFAEVFTSELASPVPLGPATVTVSPPDAVNLVTSSHTVTATSRDQAGNPVNGAVTLISVRGAVSVDGSCTTGPTGSCAFAYQGPDLPGADLITSCADTSGNGTVDPGEPCGTATKAWILPTTTPGQVTGGGQLFNATRNDKLAFGFTAKSDVNGVRGQCTTVDPTTDTKIKCLNATHVVQTATHATVFGDATVNGQPTTYRIDVDDLSEPGRGHDTFKIHTASGYTVGGVLENGNVQIHD